MDGVLDYLRFLVALVNFFASSSMFHLVTDSKWLILRAQSLLDNILAILPKLSGVLDTKAMIKHILDLLQAKTRDLGIEEVCIV